MFHVVFNTPILHYRFFITWVGCGGGGEGGREGGRGREGEREREGGREGERERDMCLIHLVFFSQYDKQDSESPDPGGG